MGVYMRKDMKINSMVLKDACDVLHNELLNHGDLYNGFKSSIRSAIDEARNYISNEDLSEMILQRIIGEI